MVCQSYMKVRVDLASTGSRQSVPVNVRNGILLVIQMSSVKPENGKKSNPTQIRFLDVTRTGSCCKGRSVITIGAGN